MPATMPFAPPVRRLAVVPMHPGAGAARPQTLQLRSARAADAAAIHDLIAAHVDEDRLLPRERADVERHCGRFVVAVRGHEIVGAAELAPLSGAVAEVRSLVVGAEARHEGLGQRIVTELARRARVSGADTLAAFTHRPGFFVRLGFSVVPHQWVPEKIQTDCHACPLFRDCGQHAMVLSLTPGGRAGRTPRS